MHCDKQTFNEHTKMTCSGTAEFTARDQNKNNGGRN